VIVERAQGVALGNDEPVRALADDTFLEQDGDATAHRFQGHGERAAELIAADAAFRRMRVGRKACARDGQDEQHVENVERRGAQNLGHKSYYVRN